MTNEIQVYEKKVNLLVERSNSQEITTAGDMFTATEILSEMNKIVDAVTGERERITKPLNEALKVERARWAPVVSAYTLAIATLRGKMSDYQTALVKATREAELAIAVRVGAGKGKLKLETAIKQLQALQVIKNNVATEAGLVSFREYQMFEVMDVTMLPVAFILANEAEIRKAMLAGTQLSGVRYFTESRPVNYR